MEVRRLLKQRDVGNREDSNGNIVWLDKVFCLSMLMARDVVT